MWGRLFRLAFFLSFAIAFGHDYTTSTDDASAPWAARQDWEGMAWPDHLSRVKDWATGKLQQHEGNGNKRLTAANANCTITIALTVSLVLPYMPPFLNGIRCVVLCRVTFRFFFRCLTKNFI